jgi:hexosaminidase
VREIAALTPGPWFHMGGDEVKTLSPAQYATFVERVQSIVRAHGKEMIGWDEIGATRLHPTTIVQYWRPNATARDAISQGNRFILSPANKVYLDMKYDSTTALGLKWAGYIEVRTAYDWDPATRIAGVRESSIVGIEAPLWAETLVTLADFEQMAFPRLAAVAEVAWSAQYRRGWEDFRVRLAAHGPRMRALGINFYRSPQIPWM